MLSILPWAWLPALHAFAAFPAPSLEYQVKAAFLLNFTKFIDWPGPDSPAPFSICILGDDPFDGTLDRMVEGETVKGRKLIVQRIGAAQASACQIVFAGRNEKGVARLLPGLGPGVLTIGEGEQFLRDGGIIAFVIDNRRVRFDINQRAAARAALKISSKLLSVARSVEK